MNDPPGTVAAAEATPVWPATFIFADIAGFTALTEAHGDEQAAELGGEFCRAVQSELPACDGSQVKSIGDALMLRVPDPARPSASACASPTGSCATGCSMNPAGAGSCAMCASPWR
jgi:class 3 adenylate cyclase